MKKIYISMFAAIMIIFSVRLFAVPAYAANEIAISSATDLKAMENNPSGSYYLTKDITVPQNMTLFTDYNKPFTGTLDGKGHKLKSYKITLNSYLETGLFKNAKNATFKNFSMTGISVNVSGNEGALVGVLVFRGDKCTFSNIKLSGKALVKLGNVQETNTSVSGLVYTGSGTISNCSTSVDIIASSTSSKNRIKAAGLAGDFYEGSIKKSSNSGNISISGNPATDDQMYAAGIAYSCKNITSCKNTGKITINVGGNNRASQIAAAGLVCDVKGATTSCSNTAAVKITSKLNYPYEISIAGLVNSSDTMSKCKNSGKVTLSGKIGSEEIYVGGLGSVISKVKYSYNKGAVKASTTGQKKVYVGGITGRVVDLRNSYNVGSVSLKGPGYVGGLSGEATPWGEKVICNYSKTKVKGSKGAVKGQLIGYYGGAEVKGKRNIYNNYYTSSGKAYGETYISWKAWVAKSNKVSSITKSKCSKLGSKYWTYSKKYKRLVLKNNKEK